MHAQPTTNVTVPSAPTVPAQAQPPQEPVQYQAEPQAPADPPAGADQPAEPASREPLFRLHTAADKAPPAIRVLALSCWAAISIFIGLVPAGRLVAGFFLQVPIYKWYAISATSMGMLGLALITAAIASIHRARLPWFLMTIATFLLAVNVAMVYVIRF